MNRLACVVVSLIVMIAAIESTGQQKQRPSFVSTYNDSANSRKDRWLLEDKKIFRKYFGYKYELIDTSNLFVYTRIKTTSYIVGKMRFYKHKTIGYFSWDKHGEIFEMTDENFDTQFALHPGYMGAFIRAGQDSLLKMHNGITLFNEIGNGGCQRGLQRSDKYKVPVRRRKS